MIRMNISYNFSVFCKQMMLVLLIFGLSACRKEERKELKNYYSAGVISTQVIDYLPHKVVLKMRFFVWDKNNNNNLTPVDLTSRIFNTEYYAGTYDSIRRITTDLKGNYSAAVIISDGIDVSSGMSDFFEILEPTVRKINYESTPENEILLVKAGNKNNPVDIIGDGFITHPELIDQNLAEICKNGNYSTTDTLCLLQTIDSVLNYLIDRASYENKHIILIPSRRVNFYKDILTPTIINKALNNDITCHLIDIGPPYYWDNITVEDCIRKLYIRSGGMYYTSPYNYTYYLENSELPMDMLQVAGKLPEIMKGGASCFEMTWTLTSGNSSFLSGKRYDDEFNIMLETNYEKEEVTVPFSFYIN